MISNWNYPTNMWVGKDRVKDLSIACKILKEFKKEEFPLLISVIESICENKKLKINW